MSCVRLLVKKARVKRILLPATTPKYALTRGIGYGYGPYVRVELGFRKFLGLHEKTIFLLIMPGRQLTPRRPSFFKIYISCQNYKIYIYPYFYAQEYRYVHACMVYIPMHVKLYLLPTVVSYGKNSWDNV